MPPVDDSSTGGFPFLFGGTFIEAMFELAAIATLPLGFPFLFGGTFIEATTLRWHLRGTGISLPFRRDFH